MAPIDFDTQEDFEFVFDIALATEFTAEISSADTIDSYTIEVSDELLDQQVKMYTPVSYTHLDVYKRQGQVGGSVARTASSS